VDQKKGISGCSSFSGCEILTWAWAWRISGLVSGFEACIGFSRERLELLRESPSHE
jgi:hypothetical protein